ncbi:MAG TPA: hypothetical protein VN455_07220 [Methanotrichaceae archaeon]|nr:hypothetical protein [Methanotrichaceae archaeon]
MMVIGLSLFGIGLAGISTISISSSLVVLMLFYYVGALGLVSAIVSLNIAGTGGIEPERQGLAAGLLTTAQQIGAAIGVSMASVVVAAVALSFGRSPASTIQGYRGALLFSEAMVIVAVVLALYLMRRYASGVRKAH